MATILPFGNDGKEARVKATDDVTGGFETDYERHAYNAGRTGGKPNATLMGQLIGNELVEQFHGTGFELTRLSLGSVLFAVYAAVLGISLLAAFGVDVGLFGGAMHDLIAARWMLTGLAAGSIMFGPFITRARQEGKWMGALAIGLTGIAVSVIALVALNDPVIGGFFHNALSNLFPSSTPEVDAALAVANAKVDATTTALETSQKTAESVLNNGVGGDDVIAMNDLNTAQDAHSAALEEQARLQHEQAVGGQYGMGRVAPILIGAAFFAAALFASNIYISLMLATLYQGAKLAMRSRKTKTASNKLRDNPAYAEVLAATHVQRAMVAYKKGLIASGITDPAALQARVDEAFSEEKVTTITTRAKDQYMKTVPERPKGRGWFGGRRQQPVANAA